MHTWITNKISQLLAFLSYPIRIIPKQSYKTEITIQDILDINDTAIVRRSLRNHKDIFDRFGSLRQDALIEDLKDVPGLSMNLLGASFKTNDIRYIAKGVASKKWDGFENKLWLNYIKYASFSCDATPIFFYLKDIHNKTVPYVVPQKTTNEEKFKKLKKAFSFEIKEDGEEATIFGASVIKHTPNKLNYWHVEFVILDIEARYTPTETKITRKRSSSNYVKTAAEHALNDILLQSAHSKADFIASIPSEHYLK
jgi:hypothetical protein